MLQDLRSLYNRKREREIDSNVLISMKEQMNFSWKEVGDLLGVSTKQISRYLACGKLPASRYYAARDALLVSIEEDSREKRDKIMKLFSSTAQT